MTLDLFQPEPKRNLLPKDGEVEDFGIIIPFEQAEQYLQYFLQHLAWQHDEAYIYGNHYITTRQMVWFGDQDYQYVYAGISRQAQQWNSVILQLKQQIEALLQISFNSCLANLYLDGTQGVSWHQDDEPSLGQQSTIASLSFGATRQFAFRHLSTQEKVEMLLHSGQLIVMRGQTQTFWQHCLRPSQKIITPRINLTFRQFQ
ncbi:alpha-ketoglutarate-dependent dioxygenase AlkB [Acinetobacter qingfengensis]|uniref:DNA methylase n=1 Tax=Acinetobacter qingfengensis TaxID=1262585 RepID=A0A1E7RE45_9GAMM|nr:alpha-ketoglutarate-dependent dioxygenase AlkB [Acinetobacter qingfengensis]KAA8733688.1 alpha-ketoglutarate-dependent dioxygenase AlkB [Acinetobacter qingfengensis]OEY97497.1 DNA methylase [Acinetobacter qingfengensis]